MAVLIKLLTLCSISFLKFYLFIYGCSGHFDATWAFV